LGTYSQRVIQQTKEAFMGTDAEDLPIPERVQALFGGALRIGYMGTVRADGQLSVVPVGVMIHDGKLRISSPSATHKIRNLERNPQISLCVPDPNDPRRFLTVRGTAELADDTGRAFVDWLARTHMGRDEYPYESRDVARTVITIQPRRFVMPKVHGAEG
jgi:PPOX class probable F420-dependent enzyme